MGHIEEQLFGAMERVARQVIEKNGADLTVNGEVIKIVNVEIGEYKVKYEGNIFSAYSETPTTVYQQGDDVYVLVPGANFNNKKIILGHSSYENSTTHTDMTEMTNKYIPLGPNWLNQQWYRPYYPDGNENAEENQRLGICAAKDVLSNDDRDNLLDGANFTAYGFARNKNTYIPEGDDIWNPYNEGILTEMTQDQLNRVDSLLQSYAARADYLMIKADFQTEFVDIHNQGEYYLVVEVLEESPEYIDIHTELERLRKESEKYSADSDKLKEYQSRINYYEQKLAVLKPDRYELNEYRLGFGAFIGQPYNYPVSTPNTAYLKITPGAIRGLAAVYLTQDGYLEADKELTIEEGRPVYKNKQLKRNNIFADNIVIQFARKVNLLDNMYYSWIETPRGDTLFIKENESGTGEVANLTQKEVTLKARLFYGYKDIMDEEDCQVYWMREYPEMTAGKYEEMDAYLHNPQPNWSDYPSSATHETAEEIYEDPGEDADPYKIDSYNYTIALRAYEEWSGTVDKWSKTYYNYTGPGWIPVEWLNEKDLKENGEESAKDRQYTINFDELTVPFYAVPIEWRYRAVIIYKGSVRTSDPITVVYNSTTGFHFDIQQFNDSNLMKEYLRIQDLDYPQDHTKTEGNVSTGTAPVKYAEEFGRWFMSLSDGSYFEITADGESGEILNKPPEQKGILRYIEVENPDKTVRKTTILDGPKHITNYLINTLIDFNIAVYRNNELRDGLKGEDLRYSNFDEYFDNWPKDEPICNLTYQVVTEEGLDLLVTWKGQDTFVYNSDGTLMGYNNQEPEKNYILTFEMKWLDGNGENYSWQVFGPGRIPLENSNHVNSFEKSMMKNMWTPDMSKEINFQVEKDYDNSKTENYIILQISTYTGKIWEIRKDLVFIKNGEQGSNGSAWFAPIYPTNFRNNTEQNMIAFSEPVITQQKPIHVSGDSLDNAVQSDDVVFTNPNGEMLEGSYYNKLIIRPFITKLGIPIEELEELDYFKSSEDSEDSGNSEREPQKKHYTYKIFWDVRYPLNSLNEGSNFAGNSGLRLCKIYGDSFEEASFGGPFTLGEIDLNHRPNTTLGNGLIGETAQNEITHGAVEVRFAQPYSGASFNDCHYNFYVKATIDIYEYFGEKKTNFEDISETKSKVTTLTSYYPVDILLEIPNNYSSEIPDDQTDYNIKIDDRKLNIAWPKNIKYNITGYQPQTTREELIFEYIDEDYSSGRLAPESLYPKLLQIKQNEKNKFDENGELVSTGEYSYYASPRNYTFWVDNHHPVLKASWSIKHSQVTADALNLTYEEKAWYEALKKYFELVNSKNVAQYRYDEEYKNWFDTNTEKYLNELNQTVKEIEDRELIFDQNGNILAKPDGNEPLNSFEYYRTVIYDLDIYGGNMAINGWDGTRIDINQDQGTIFAPTIGAGYKDPFKNTFTGVIMGIDTSQVKPGEDANYAKFPTEETEKNNYMTGLYGYQDGVISFGIMENGTAFFGRADRGGRIVIDGYNAQIYGGLAGEATNDIDGSRDMDMTNRMRLSFIDFDNIAWNDHIGNTDNNEKEEGTLKEHGGSINVDGTIINTGSYNVRNFQFYFSNVTEEDTSIKAKVAGFGSGRGYSTPAIEIGSYQQYIDGGSNRHGYDLIKQLTISDFRQSSYYSNIQNLEIPGYRKFLVTYDGTLYAMNAFIKGNLVSSNIIGSQFFNGDGTFAVTENGNLGIGKGDSSLYEWIVYEGEESTKDYKDRWSYTIPRLQAKYLENYFDSTSRPDFNSGNFNFFVSNKGVVTCKEIHIAGGSLDIGDFHIIGSNSKYNPGDVVSYGTLYLVGDKPTIPLDPDDGQLTVDKKSSEISSTAIAIEAWGNMHLRGRIVNLGQVLLGGAAEKIPPISDNMNFGASIDSEDGKKFYATTFNSPFSITSNYTMRTDGKEIKKVKGAFWPLYYHAEALKTYEEGGSQPGWDNRGWVCLSSGEHDLAQTNTYTLQFAVRQPNEEGKSAVVPANVKENVVLPGIANWRVDSNGMWADTILLRRNITGMTGYDKISNDQMMEKTEALFGFIEGDDEQSVTINVGLKNMSVDAPSFVIETPRNIRLSTGFSPYDTNPNHQDMAIYLNAGVQGEVRSSLVLHGYNSIATLDSEIIILGPGREGDASIEKGLHIRVPYINVETAADKQVGIYARFG